MEKTCLEGMTHYFSSTDQFDSYFASYSEAEGRGMKHKARKPLHTEGQTMPQT